MFEQLLSLEIWLSLLTLTCLEIVLGIDNIIFISILAGKLPPSERDKARKLGLIGALVSRLALLSVISFVVKLTTPLFTFLAVEFSGKSLILLVGGLFLLFKATKEMHEKLEGEEHGQIDPAMRPPAGQLSRVIVQIMLLDIVFSLDSVITAVGMSQILWVMVAANIIALAIMLIASGYISAFVDRHPSIKILALSFLLMIGLVLVADGVGFHIPKGYIYFAMGFSVIVEFFNIKATRRSQPVHLHSPLE